jgi:hypothetical protein
MTLVAQKASLYRVGAGTEGLDFKTAISTAYTAFLQLRNEDTGSFERLTSLVGDNAFQPALSTDG